MEQKLKPEQPNHCAPFTGGAVESARHLELPAPKWGRQFVYVRSCHCCGHWFLCMQAPIEVCLDYVGRTLQAYDLHGVYPAFAQMIIPALPGKRALYVDWFISNLGPAWDYVHKGLGQTYTIPYADMPGHEPAPPA